MEGKKKRYEGTAGKTMLDLLLLFCCSALLCSVLFLFDMASFSLQLRCWLSRFIDHAFVAFFPLFSFLFSFRLGLVVFVFKA